MANLNETPSWDSVPRTERTTKWLGANDQTGDIGTANLAPQALANRTEWLRQQQQDHAGATDPHPQYTTPSEVQALIEARVGDYVIGTGTGNAITAVLVPAIAAYDATTTFTFKSPGTNTTAVTLNAGGGARPLVREDGTPMQAGDIVVGAVVSVVYDVATASFRSTEMVASQVSAAIAAHAALPDPHTQYATKAAVQAQTYTAFSTAGVAPNFTMTVTPSLAAYTQGQRFRVKFHAGVTGASTINLNGLGSKSLKQYNYIGAKVNAVIASGQLVDAEYDGVDFVLLDPLPGFSVQPGEVAFFAMNGAPEGYMKANGAAVSRTTYAALFAAIGTVFGAGDGVSTFNLPDLRGEFPRGFDDGRGVDVGRVFGSAQAGTRFPSLYVYSASSTAGVLVSHPINSNPTYPNDNTAQYMDSQAHLGSGAYMSTTLSPAGGSSLTAFTARPRNVALLACIKF